MSTAVPQTFGVADAVELAVVERSGFIESRHAGSAIVLGPEGEVLASLGAPDAPVFPRSCLKPFQAITIMNAGVSLEGAQAVLATASHAGTRKHVQVVRSMLGRARIEDSALQCPADWPGDRASRDELVRDGLGTSPLYMNCSGKHAAMLLACAQNGWDQATYLEPDHPLQLAVRDTVERFTGEKPAASGVDGCGAPVYAVSLTGLARGIGRVVNSSPTSPFALYRNAGLLTAAVLANGWALDGPGRANTLVIERLGLFAKLGAEGVMVMSAPGGATVALKVLDGSLRASTIIALRLLVSVGALDAAAVDALEPELDLAIHGGAAVVGRIAVTAV
ncbi:asparaginase [Plantibacter auratus]|uniref:asparaginase n=1 Tax=Plantibacter auratus TaxID=272914 RepID=UPI003D357F1F